MKTIPVSILAALVVFSSFTLPVRGEHEGKIQILLLGDSTTEGSIPRKIKPKGPHLEKVIEQLLAGYNVIADETAKYLAKIMRERHKKK